MDIDADTDIDTDIDTDTDMDPYTNVGIVRCRFNMPVSMNQGSLLRAAILIL